MMSDNTTILLPIQRKFLIKVKASDWFIRLTSLHGLDQGGEHHIYPKVMVEGWLNMVLTEDGYGSEEDKYWLNSLRNAYLLNKVFT